MTIDIYVAVDSRGKWIASHDLLMATSELLNESSADNLPFKALALSVDIGDLPAMQRMTCTAKTKTKTKTRSKL